MTAAPPAPRSSVLALVLLAGVLAGCGTPPAPSFGPPLESAAPSTGPSVGPTAVGPTPVLDPTPTATAPDPTVEPSFVPAPGAERAAWAIVEPVAGRRSVEAQVVHYGFLGEAAIGELALEAAGRVELASSGDLVLVTHRLARATRLVVVDLTDAAVRFDVRFADEDGIREAQIDGRSDQLYYTQVDRVDGGLRFHRVDLGAETDTVMLELPRPWGADWADREHTAAAVVNLMAAETLYVVCDTGPSCAPFRVRAEGGTAERLPISLHGLDSPICGLLGGLDRWLFVRTAGPDKACGSSSALTSVTFQRIDLADGAVEPVFPAGTKLTTPVLVRSDTGGRIVWLERPTGATSANLLALDLRSGKVTVLVSDLPEGRGLLRSTWISLLPVGAPVLDGQVLLVPMSDNAGVPWALLGRNGPRPRLVDVATGEQTEIRIFDYPLD